MKDKKGITITNAFQKILDESNHKPNKNEFSNRSMKSWLEKNIMEMYSIHNKGKSVAAERFIRIVKNKTNKDMTSISKSMYIDKLDNIMNKYNNAYHRAIKMKPVDLKQSTYIDFNKEINKEDPKYKVGDNVRISKYKNIFAKAYVPNRCEEIFAITKFRNIALWTNVISDLNGEEIVRTIYEKNLQKTNQKELRVEKAIKRKGNKLHVKWKGYGCSFNSWIDK